MLIFLFTKIIDKNYFIFFEKMSKYPKCISKIKCASRPNMKYLVHLIIWSFARDILADLTDHYFNSNANLIYPLLMFFAEFIFGLIIYLYEKKHYLKRIHNDNAQFMGIELITNNISLKIKDNNYKICCLVIFASFFDFIEFTTSIELGNRFKNFSNNINGRLDGLLIIFDAIIYRYVLKFPIFRHQIFSLLIIAICLIITIIIIFISQENNIFSKSVELVLFIFLHCLILFYNSLVDIIEKYLFEYDYFNPFRILFLEGLLGFLFSLIYFIYKNPIHDLKNYFNQQNSINLALIIISFILYIILSGIGNCLRVVTNKIYSPMASTLSEYILNPLYLIFFFFLNKDFNLREKAEYAYFSINLILSIIISFSAFVYNEFVILFFCKLQHETYQQISFRANYMNDNRGSQILLDDDDDSNIEMTDL